MLILHNLAYLKIFLQNYDNINNILDSYNKIAAVSKTSIDKGLCFLELVRNLYIGLYPAIYDSKIRKTICEQNFSLKGILNTLKYEFKLLKKNQTYLLERANYHLIHNYLELLSYLADLIETQKVANNMSLELSNQIIDLDKKLTKSTKPQKGFFNKTN